MRVVLCGYHLAGCRALDLLVESGHDVFVFTHESPYHVPDLARFCEKIGIGHTTEAAGNSLLPWDPDIVCSIYYRRRIPVELLTAVSGKAFNLHPSLLPKYRGCSSLTWAMVNGETEAGFSYHYLEKDFDTGRVLLQETLEIHPYDTQETLYHRAMLRALDRFSDVLSMVQRGEPGTPQQGDGEYFGRGCPHGGEIDPGWDLEKKERFIRAMTFPPYPPATFRGRQVLDIDDLLREEKRGVGAAD